MKKQGIKTQKELAQKMGISQNQLSMLLSANFNPIKSNALLLCKSLNTNLTEITEPPKNEEKVNHKSKNISKENLINTSSFEGNEFVEQ